MAEAQEVVLQRLGEGDKGRQWAGAHGARLGPQSWYKSGSSGLGNTAASPFNRRIDDQWVEMSLLSIKTSKVSFHAGQVLLLSPKGRWLDGTEKFLTLIIPVKGDKNPSRFKTRISYNRFLRWGLPGDIYDKKWLHEVHVLKTICFL